MLQGRYTRRQKYNVHFRRSGECLVHILTHISFFNFVIILSFLGQLYITINPQMSLLMHVRLH